MNDEFVPSDVILNVLTQICGANEVIVQSKCPWVACVVPVFLFHRADGKSHQILALSA
jgi:hypothetical protein